MASLARATHHESRTATRSARATTRHGSSFQNPPQLAALVQLSHLLRASYPPPVYENLRQRHLVLSYKHLQLGEISRVHRDITLVEEDAKATKNRQHCAAIVESLAHGSEGGGVDDYLLGEIMISVVAGDFERITVR